jgi:predicted transcriptional regulator
MNEKTLKTLLALRNGPQSVREIALSLHLSYSRAAAIVRNLIKNEYCRREGRKISLSKNAKTVLFKSLSEKYNPIQLLGGTREDVLLALLTGPLRIPELQRRTGLAQSTLYQALRILSSLGAVRKEGQKYSLADDSDLRSFLQLLRIEKVARDVEPYAVILRSDGFRLKRVPAGLRAEGSLTAFSLFPRYGVNYVSPHDYYIEPPREITAEEVLVHALACSETKSERTLCAVFYVKNLGVLDRRKLRELAREFGVLPLLVELEGYVDGHPEENFLPPEEFVEKAKLYGIEVRSTPGMQILEALKQIGGRLEKEIHAYLFGGVNMLLRGLKGSTKDLDLVVERKDDFQEIRGKLIELGYRELEEEKLTPNDRRVNPSGIFVSEGWRIDLFTEKICGVLTLSEGMKKRSEERRFGRLTLHLLDLGDVFLLKSITDREGDLEDMHLILSRGDVRDWEEIWQDYLEQEKTIKQHLCFMILDSLDILKEKFGETVPIYQKVLRHCTDVGILKAISYGKREVKEIRELINCPESTLRNRIEALAKEGRILKHKSGKRVLLSLTPSGRELLFEPH